MLNPTEQLPVPLKALVWATILIAAIEVTLGGYSLMQTSLSECLMHIADAGIALLGVVGVLGRYRLIRSLCLVLSFAGAALKSGSLIFQMRAPTPFMIVDFMVLGFFVFIISALCATSAKAYFKAV